MNELPDSIQQYLHNRWLENGKFAWLSFDHQGFIKGWHRNIDYYALTDLHSGERAVEKLIFLEGLLPYQETDVFILPSVGFSNGVAADIHILQVENDVYALFFDVTENVNRLQVLQQDRHNLDLLYQQQHKNINLLKQAYQELDAKKKQVEITNKEKIRFWSQISHDLRTPLTSILGFAHLLQANIFGELTDKQRNCIEKMVAAGKHMNELVNDLLDVAHLESGSFELHTESLVASFAITECLAWLQPIAERQQIKLINRVQSTVKIQADAKRFKQIMLNVLNNAIKYNREQGCIVIACHVLEKSLRIIVRDTGIGIADHQLEKIFQPFARVLDKNQAKQIQGHGIGLGECKQLIELMQGSFSVRSELAVGSVFYIDLPLTTGGQEENTHPPTHRLVYCHLKPINYELLTNMVSVYKNCQIIGCDSIEQAAQQCFQHAATAILIDIDSEQWQRDITQLQKLQRQLNGQQVIAVFAKQTPAVVIQQFFEQTQIYDYLTRPFDFNQVLDMLG